MCPIRVRRRTKAVQVNTAVPCADHAAHLVKQIVLDLKPMRGIKGALDEIADVSGVSFWKLRKLWNPSLQRHGFTWEADEHRDLRVAHIKFMAEQRALLQARLEEIDRLREERQGEDQQLGLGL